MEIHMRATKGAGKRAAKTETLRPIEISHMGPFLSIMLSDEESFQIAAAARREGVPDVSTWARSILLSRALGSGRGPRRKASRK
jgi:hypothetical protein